MQLAVLGLCLGDAAQILADHGGHWWFGLSEGVAKRHVVAAVCVFIEDVSLRFGRIGRSPGK